MYLLEQMKPEEELRMVISESARAFEGVAHEEWAYKTHPSKWSKKEILGHLIDSAQTNLRRFVMTQYVQNQKIVYHQDEWVALQRYQEADIEELIDLWKGLNLQIARVTDRIPEADLKNTCDTGKEGPEYHDLEFLISDYIVHMKHHLRQVLGNQQFLA